MEPRELKRELASFVERFEPALTEALDRGRHAHTAPLHEAMQYVVLAGGKRLRPLVIELWARQCGRSLPEEEVRAAGVAVELIHGCSLVLDDLPSMDDARTRRGRPCCHVAFGVDVAILAANGLLMIAFEMLGELDRRRAGLGASELLARVVGPGGMVGGQYADLHLTIDARDLEALEFIHRQKTGVLFEACAQLGVRLGGGAEGLEELARVYARNLGLAFQIKDDLLDATGHAEEMGKDARQDRGKPTWPACLGLAESEEIMLRLLATAREAAARAPRDARTLAALCDYVGTRRH